MRPCASTNSHEQKLWSGVIDYRMEETLAALKQAGFEAADICLCSYARGAYPLAQPTWRSWCESVRDTAKEIGIDIPNAHAHFFALRDDFSEDPWDRELMERSIAAAGVIGVKTMVFHPYQVEDQGWYSFEKAKEVNMKLFREYALLCRPLGIRIAIENMVGQNRGRRYCSGADELIDLVDSLNDPIFGICWDFGHANLNGISQPEALRKIGKRLCAVHVNDNNGVYDDHSAPFHGNISWLPIMEAIRDIGYDGDWTYEIFNFHNGLPDELKAAALEYSLKISRYMISLAK